MDLIYCRSEAKKSPKVTVKLGFLIEKGKEEIVCSLLSLGELLGEVTVEARRMA